MCEVSFLQKMRKCLCREVSVGLIVHSKELGYYLNFVCMLLVHNSHSMLHIYSSIVVPLFPTILSKLSPKNAVLRGKLGCVYHFNVLWQIFEIFISMAVRDSKLLNDPKTFQLSILWHISLLFHPILILFGYNKAFSE